MDFFLWGHLKNQVYVHKSNTLEELQDRIIQTAASISPDVLRNSVQHFIQRIHYCQEINGGHFENRL